MVDCCGGGSNKEYSENDSKYYGSGPEALNNLYDKIDRLVASFSELDMFKNTDIAVVSKQALNNLKEAAKVFK